MNFCYNTYIVLVQKECNAPRNSIGQLLYSSAQGVPGATLSRVAEVLAPVCPPPPQARARVRALRPEPRSRYFAGHGAGRDTGHGAGHGAGQREEADHFRVF